MGSTPNSEDSSFPEGTTELIIGRYQVQLGVRHDHKKIDTSFSCDCDYVAHGRSENLKTLTQS